MSPIANHILVVHIVVTAKMAKTAKTAKTVRTAKMVKMAKMAKMEEMDVPDHRALVAHPRDAKMSASRLRKH
jgi:hypothetical protein